MRKVHYKVVLDVFLYAYEDADIGSRLSESGFIIDPENNVLDEVAYIQDITIESVEVTDSR